MAKDPYRYFRIEARELLDGLSHGVLELEKSGASKDALAKLLRFAHTLKGAARVVKQNEIAELAHAIEDALEPFREGTSTPMRVDPVLLLLDRVGVALQQLDRAPVAAMPNVLTAPAPAPALEVASIETVRVELRELDTLLRGVAETGVHLATLRRQLATLAEPLQRSLGGALEQVERELVEVRDTADRLRLLPISVVAGSLERAARDAAQALDRDVELRVVGGDHRLDANVLGKLGEALMHSVRNAIAHGIESADDRRAAGKSPAGTIEITITRRGARLLIACRDDGRGIDVRAVGVAAVQRGRMDPRIAEALDLDGAIALLLRGGVSTTAVADATSGRGVGLDVIRAVMSELRGELNVRSSPGHGTTIELSLPVSISSVTALIVEANDVRVTIPLSAVPRVVRVPSANITYANGRASLDQDGVALPVLQLGEIVGSARSRPRVAAIMACAVLVDADEQRCALIVDRLLGTAEIVVRPLPTHAAIDAIVAGASLDGDGNPCLLLDPVGINVAARAARQSMPAPVAAQAPPIVLVIDDSLTTRMLEQSILESAGYTVELAVSAEDGLAKAQARHYGLFLVDVEMPGMDGFEFVTRTRQDPQLRATPAILVTSRSSPEDRRRGKEAGAAAYIVKGELDQRHLLQTIRGLIG